MGRDRSVEEMIQRIILTAEREGILPTLEFDDDWWLGNGEPDEG